MTTRETKELVHPLSVQGKADGVKYSEVTDATIDPLLLKLLQVRSPTKILGIEAETTVPIIKDFVNKLTPSRGVSVDKCGNLIVRVGALRDHHTVFSCHMDTVHWSKGTNTIIIDSLGYLWAIDDTKAPSILGADDKVGVYICLKMIEANIPGMYVFHVGEERGGIGSTFLAKEHEGFFAAAERCIAFDRKDTKNVITRQFSGICCSDAFAEALASQLNAPPMGPANVWAKDTTGTFTDSASYMHLIPECTNLSVGYYDQHTAREHQDWVFLKEMLLPRILKIDWSSLPTVRVPCEAPRFRRQESTQNTQTTSNTRVDPKTWEGINLATPYEKLPPFDITKGLDSYLGASDYAIQRAIERQMLLEGVPKFASTIMKVLLEYEDTICDLVISDDDTQEEIAKCEAQIKELQKKIEDLEKDKKARTTKVDALISKIKEKKGKK